MPQRVDTLDDLEQALDGAALLGLELDTRYRVLAATLEPTPDRDPWSGGSRADRRVQLLCSPVSTILVSLRRVGEEGTELLAFSDQQLVDVVAALDGPPVEAPIFGSPEPRPGEWSPEWSLEGRSTAPDGTRRTVTFRVSREEPGGVLALDVFARFDDVEVRDVDGDDLVTGL